MNQGAYILELPFEKLRDLENFQIEKLNEEFSKLFAPLASIPGSDLENVLKNLLSKHHKLIDNISTDDFSLYFEPGG